MIDQDGIGDETGGGSGQAPSWRRRGLGAGVAVAIAVAAWVATMRPRAPQAPAVATSAPSAEPAGAAPDANGGRAKAGPAPPGGRGVVSRTMVVVELTPSAQMQAEKFRCVCGCKMSLGECYCSKTPGSVDMKRHLQALVDAGESPAGIEKGMVEKYGPAVKP